MRAVIYWTLVIFAVVSAQGVSSNGQCGKSNGGRVCTGSKFGSCCSQYGWCGSTPGHCGSGCDPKYGTCTSSGSVKKVSSDGRCAGSKGSTCQGSIFGNCCSKYGYCGSSSAYCGTGCNALFGSCAIAQSSTERAYSTLQTSIRLSSTGAAASPSSPAKVSTNSRCGLSGGASGGFSCLGSKFGDCCSQYGYCGSTSAYCGAKCQPGFGTCTTTVSSSSLRSPPSSSSTASSTAQSASSSIVSTSTLTAASTSSISTTYLTGMTPSSVPSSLSTVPSSVTQSSEEPLTTPIIPAPTESSRDSSSSASESMIASSTSLSSLTTTSISAHDTSSSPMVTSISSDHSQASLVPSTSAAPSSASALSTSEQTPSSALPSSTITPAGPISTESSVIGSPISSSTDIVSSIIVTPSDSETASATFTPSSTVEVLSSSHTSTLESTSQGSDQTPSPSSTLSTNTEIWSSIMTVGSSLSTLKTTTSSASTSLPSSPAEIMSTGASSTTDVPSSTSTIPSPSSSSTIAVPLPTPFDTGMIANGDFEDPNGAIPRVGAGGALLVRESTQDLPAYGGTRYLEFTMAQTTAVTNRAISLIYPNIAGVNGRTYRVSTTVRSQRGKLAPQCYVTFAFGINVVTSSYFDSGSVWEEVSTNFRWNFASGAATPILSFTCPGNNAYSFGIDNVQILEVLEPPGFPETLSAPFRKAVPSVIPPVDAACGQAIQEPSFELFPAATPNAATPWQFVGSRYVLPYTYSSVELKRSGNRALRFNVNAISSGYTARTEFYQQNVVVCPNTVYEFKSWSNLYTANTVYNCQVALKVNDATVTMGDPFSYTAAREFTPTTGYYLTGISETTVDLKLRLQCVGPTGITTMTTVLFDDVTFTPVSALP